MVAEGSRLEANLSCKAGTMFRKVKAVKGRARETILAGSIHIALCAGDIVNLCDLLQEVELLEGKVEDIALEMRGKESTVKALKEEIARLATTDQLTNVGWPIAEVGERQQRWKLSQFKSSVEKVLWFATSFGLEIVSLTNRTSQSEIITFSFGDSTAPVQPASPPIDETVIMQTLYLLERFGVSDEFYHELTQVCMLSYMHVYTYTYTRSMCR